MSKEKFSWLLESVKANEKIRDVLLTIVAISMLALARDSHQNNDFLNNSGLELSAKLSANLDSAISFDPEPLPPPPSLEGLSSQSILAELAIGSASDPAYPPYPSM